MNEAILKTQELKKVYGGSVVTEALRGIDLEVMRGNFTCIVGPSGHGKSTLLHILGGLDRPTSGKVFLDGVDMTQLSDNELTEIRLRRTGFVFQFFNLVPNLTALENVELPLMFAGISANKQEVKAKDLLDQLGLADKLNSKPNQLSGGQQQRVAIARALANEPDILLMDEPTGNLDSGSGAEVLDYVVRVNKEGKTMVLVTHHEGIAERAQQIVRVVDGIIQ